jgi:hypothetical protein
VAISDDGLYILPIGLRYLIGTRCSPLPLTPSCPHQSRMSQVRTNCQFVTKLLLQSTKYTHKSYAACEPMIDRTRCGH